ncbi:Transposase DDE domain protein [Corynebacterium occultum]|uniref:Transposase DDE domain protein n=1 Tax=Corynebacterium occultum TaxID=2675219 RepID=A0A6B8W0K1_9CORY|nr:IS1380 family transposase [Corynebacterium occultum]QGU07044.1 Transposase DDE domain protein [Corynebacterium occultum]
MGVLDASTHLLERITFTVKITSFHIDTPTTSQLCSNAGLMLLASTADRVGVADAIDTALGDLQKPTLVHTTGHTMTALALSLAIGGDDASDIDLLNPLVATGLIDKIPSDPTIHRRHKELHDSSESDDNSTALVNDAGTNAVLAGMNTARTTAWAACGTRNPATTATIMNPLVIDLDATEVTSHSDKEHARPTWKKHFGFHPLAAIIDHGQGLTGEPVSVLLRPGSAGSNTAADHITVMNQTMAALPGHTDGAPWGRRLLVRTDAAGGTKKFINHLDQQGLAYSVGLATSWLIADIASTLTEVTKQGVIGPEGTISNIDDAYVADISTKVRTLGPSATGINIEDYPPDMRFIIRVEHAARGAQLRTVDVDGRRIQMFVTNRKGHAQRLDELHRARGRCEQRIRDMKDCGLGKLPHTTFRMNQAWAHSAVLAMNLISWAQMITAATPPAGSTPRQRWWVWEPKTLRARILSIAGVVVRHARRLSIRFDGAATHRELLEHGLSRLRSTA